MEKNKEQNGQQNKYKKLNNVAQIIKKAGSVALSIGALVAVSVLKKR